jgi:hypothetical protein
MKTTVRASLERGLRRMIGRRRPAASFTLRDAAFHGDGLVAGHSLRDWETIRDLSDTEPRTIESTADSSRRRS